MKWGKIYQRDADDFGDPFADPDPEITSFQFTSAELNDKLYEHGYHQGRLTGSKEPLDEDHPSYKMGYEDGRGDRTRELEALSKTGDFSIDDIHDTVNNIFNERANK